MNSTIDISKIKAFVFDLDGTIYYGSKIIDGVLDLLDFLENKGIKIFFATNNSTKNREQIFQKLNGMGIKIEKHQIYSSGYVAAVYVKKENLNNLFIFGSGNLKDEFLDMGISITENEQEAENLIIGYDPDFNYDKVTKALHVALKGNTIIACNKEKHFPGEDAIQLPGCGAMVGCIEMCANRESDLVIGKPNTLMLQTLATENDLKNNEILVIGDTYESDIVMADTFECKSILISTKNHQNSVISVSHIGKIIDLLSQ